MTIRKRDHLKLLCGTARPDRTAPAAPALPALEAVPSPPAWVTNLDAVKEWQRLAGVLTACKLLNVGNVGLFAQYVSLHARLVATWTEGATPTAALITAFRKLSSDLGLTSMSVPAPTAKPNKFLTNARLRK